MNFEKKNQRLLLSSTWITGIGNVLFTFAINWWIMNVSENPLILGTVNAIIFIPKILLSLFGGAIADIGNRKKILFICDLCCGILNFLLSLLVVSLGFKINVIVCINILITIFQTVYNPTTRAIIPDLFSKSKIITINSKITIINQIVRVISPLLGGVLVNINVVGVAGLFCINGFTFLVTAIIDLYLIYTPPAKTKNISVKEILKTTFLGLKIYSKKENILMLQLLVLITLTNFWISGYELSIPVLGAMYTKFPFDTYSFFMALIAIGCLIGARTVQGEKEIISLGEVTKSSVYMCIPFFLLAILKNFIAICICIIIYAILETRFNVLFFSYIQIKSDKKYLGRIISNVLAFAGILVPIGNLFFGYTLSKSYSSTLLTIAVGMFILNIVFWVKARRYDKIN